MRGNTLIKATARDQTLPNAELEDYAYVAQGLLDHARATGDRASRQLAVRLARTAWRLFWSDHGWLRKARPLLATVMPEPALADGALFSPPDVLIRASLELGDAELARRAHKALAWRIPDREADPHAYPTRTMLLGRDADGRAAQPAAPR